MSPPPPDGYDFVFHLGVGAPGGIKVEKLAHKYGYNNADVDGQFAPIVSKGDTAVVRGFGKGYEKMPGELFSRINVESLVDSLNESDSNVFVSTDPGRYLCDFIYYCSQAESLRLSDAQSPKRSPVLFMHVPPLEDTHTLEQMTETVKKVVQWVISQEIAEK